MSEYTWRYSNSRITLDQLVQSIHTWTHSAGYMGKTKKKKDASILTINRGPGAWKGKVILTVSGNPQTFAVHLNTGKAPFENVANSLPQVILHYTGAAEYVAPVQPVQPAPAAQPKPVQPQPVAQPVQQQPVVQHVQPQPQPVTQPVQQQPVVQPVQAQPAAQPVQPAPQVAQCPTCGGQANFIEQYNRWYCYNCKAYL